MSVNGTVNKIYKFDCSQCHEEIYCCYNCNEPFQEDEFVSCGDDGNHICEQCYKDFGPKALNEDK
jgi:hypothetical protein